MFFRRSTCFEATDRRIAVIGGEAAVSKAEFLRGYSKAVSLIWSSDAKPPATEEFAKTGISLVPHPAGLEICKQKICVVTPEGRESFDILYPALGCTVESDLARKLGAAVTDVGCLKVDAHRQVVVFTHDLTFLYELRREAEAKGQTIHYQTVFRRNEKPGHIEGELPNKARSALITSTTRTWCSQAILPPTAGS